MLESCALDHVTYIWLCYNRAFALTFDEIANVLIYVPRTLHYSINELKTQFTESNNVK